MRVREVLDVDVVADAGAVGGVVVAAEDLQLLPTPDGTGVRDYIHVVDLVEGHLAALDALERVSGAIAVNLGTGVGYSVLDVIREASAAAGREIPYVVGARRPGDIAAVWADPAHASELLGWRATRTLADMCADHWRWQASNPDGYGSATLG